MSLTTLEIKCRTCKKVNEKQVRVIEPESFSKNGTKSVMAHHWCEYCRAPIAYRYTFVRKKDKTIQAKVVKHLNHQDFFDNRPEKPKLTARPKSRS